ncbi:hypothetical protein [Planctobacterium marinum]|uniref:Uncharacterized protein n=1 Tax=Planctobacterium marinum TaxID=1631968 RepID=A0AA48HJG0_9ALTE|nr:hypothetical protein MACH26_19050 [Planctobacterium marinum]
MVIRLALTGICAVMLGACTSQEQTQMCIDYEPVCKALKNQGMTRVIISIDEFADKTAFVAELEKQGVIVHKVIDATPQVIAEINYGQLLHISRMEVTTNLNLDRFHVLKESN